MKTIKASTVAELPKSLTGIRGLDEITRGGLPKGRPTLVCGPAGCGKTLMGMEFLVHGADKFDEPGVFVAFEETAQELTENVASLGFDLKALTASKKILIDYVYIERSEIEVTGEYDLEGLFIRLGHAIKSTGAKRVVLDTIEALFSGLPNQAILRAELRRLFRWLKEKGVTVLITGERGENTLTRYGMEEYVSDCVIVLDNRVIDQLSTRRMRIVKYRGSAHGTNEYPFLIDEKGISVLPVSSLGLNHVASTERVSSGIPRLDTMLGDKGYYKGSTVLFTGTAGSGKTSMAASFVTAACSRSERCLVFLYEESPSQYIRNMRSIGLDMQKWIDKGLLRFHAARPLLYGLEMHLVTTIREVDEYNPVNVILDPVSTLSSLGSGMETKQMLTRLIDYLKIKSITTIMVDLTFKGRKDEHSQTEVSSLTDTWILLSDRETGSEHNRELYILKSRGMAHSNQVREFNLTDKGLEITDVYKGTGEMLTGSARLAQEALDKAEILETRQKIEMKKLILNHKRQALKNKIALLQAEFEAEEAETENIISIEEQRENLLNEDRREMGIKRKAD